MRHFIALLGAAALSVSVANAADMPVKAPVMVAAPVYNWTGVYLGVNGGGGWGRETYGENTTAPCPPCVTVNHSPSGGIFGGQLGYRWQINQFVLGVEGTWDWAGLRSNVDVIPGFANETLKVRSLYSVTGQAGWAWDRWLAYVKGGWAGASTNFFFDAFGGPFTANYSQTANGWTIGAGIDYAIWQNFILGVEYDHFDLDYGSFATPWSTGGNDIVANTSRLTIDQVVARLSYKFDWR